MEQPATADPLIGATIGNYKIKSKLGEGGMGSVYMAEHPLIGKRVALKVLHAEFSSKEDVVKRFFQEAKAVNDIQHPNIVDIVDYGVITSPHGQSTVYFIMEFLDGPSLADVIRNEAPLAPERALSIGVQIADALGACHQAGVVHRDLKPDNILLIPRGRERDFVKVLDFGIAKLTGDQKVSVRTRTGLLMGTPAYMSPEQCEGSATVDHRTDVYALGAVVHETLTGEIPYERRREVDKMMAHLSEPPPRPSAVS
ncbi:MAG TPA: serine/threonine-protein kinase, partial [Haliangium sp.]|nr:serine/threonine-protein kinase [Haliangium sp.]